MNEEMSENDGNNESNRSMMEALLQAEQAKDESDSESSLQLDDINLAVKHTPRQERRISSLSKFDICLEKEEISEQATSNGGAENSNKKTVKPTFQIPRIRSREDLVKVSNEKISRVEKSWYIISNRIGEVGLKFFLRMFDEYPELVQLFPFGDDIDPKSGKLILNARTMAHVRAHATAVMRVVGTSVAGLTSIDDLIPRLRQVGSTHKMVGVQSMHYDILFRHLMKAIREEVGPDNWDQETEDAWDQAFTSISDLIKRPSARLETEPLRSWGLVILSACTYFMVVTPFRFAGFLYGRPRMVILLNALDGLGALVLLMDLLVYLIQSKLSVRRVIVEDEIPTGDRRMLFQKTKSFHKSTRNIILNRRNSLVKKLQSFRLNRWVPWPSMDIKVLLSFPLQYMIVRGSICSQVGLHWTQLIGLIRVVTALRVNHFLQCAENNAILEQKLDADRQLQLNMAKLLFRLAFITHVSACMWCIVTRLGLGLDATEFTPSPFFPNSDLFGSESNVFNSYSRAIYWAFVNLSGIGDVDSNPTSTLECWTTLIVHMIGAVFYAILTGNVIAILEERSKRDNKIGTDIVRLSNYMNTARVSKFSKERIMKGYMMRNVLTQASLGSPQGNGESSDGLDLNDEVLGTLPNYLRVEVGIYARAELIRRRDPFFSHCSNGFLVALSSSLSQTRTLLTGDYLMNRGMPYVPEFVFVQSGSLQVRREQHTIKTLNRGDVVGKAWLLQLTNETIDPKECNETTDWLLNDGTAGVSIRALSPCVLLTGLSTTHDIDVLMHGYRVDFQLLQAEARGTSMDETERRAAAMKGIAKAVRLFKARRAQRQSSRSSSRQNSLDSEAIRRVISDSES